jgi:hypothetical protein
MGCEAPDVSIAGCRGAELGTITSCFRSRLATVLMGCEAPDVSIAGCRGAELGTITSCFRFRLGHFTPRAIFFNLLRIQSLFFAMMADDFNSWFEGSLSLWN